MCVGSGGGRKGCCEVEFRGRKCDDGGRDEGKEREKTVRCVWREAEVKEGLLLMNR